MALAWPKALSQIDSNIDMFGMGGTLMEQAGVRIVYDIKNLGVIGIVEIIKSLPKFFKLRTYLKRVMLKEKPDVLVCIDYPGFNMKLAEVAHEFRNSCIVLYSAYNLGHGIVVVVRP